ncbi:MAG: hypothetical protein ACKPFK_21195 [Dolichospermum sp.]
MLHKLFSLLVPLSGFVPSNGAAEILLIPSTAQVMAFCQRGSPVIQERAREMGRQFLVERFQLTDVSEQFDPSERIIRLGDIRPQIASLAFDENEASRFIEDIPAAPTF